MTRTTRSRTPTGSQVLLAELAAAVRGERARSATQTSVTEKLTAAERTAPRMAEGQEIETRVEEGPEEAL
jgi:hypothetical protein